jgi:hypothetical protein
MPQRDNQEFTVVVIEMGPGLVRVRFAGPVPEPSRADVLLRKTIDSWLSVRPQLVIDQVQPVIEAEEVVGADLWLHAVNAPIPHAQLPPSGEPLPWTIQVSGHILTKLPKEHVEAIIDEAMGVWNEQQARQSSLMVVNARRIVVILDGLARRGAVVPVDDIEHDLDDQMRQALYRWFQSPRTRLIAIPVPYGWSARQASMPAKPRVVETSFVRTNMVYDRHEGHGS